jgi:hypothetical protein
MGTPWLPLGGQPTSPLLSHGLAWPASAGVPGVGYISHEELRGAYFASQLPSSLPGSLGVHASDMPDALELAAAAARATEPSILELAPSMAAAGHNHDRPIKLVFKAPPPLQRTQSDVSARSSNNPEPETGGSGGGGSNNAGLFSRHPGDRPTAGRAHMPEGQVGSVCSVSVWARRKADAPPAVLNVVKHLIFFIVGTWCRCLFLFWFNQGMRLSRLHLPHHSESGPP